MMLNPITLTNKSKDEDFVRYGYFDALLGLGTATVDRIKFNPSERQRICYTLGYKSANGMIESLASKVGLRLIDESKDN
jgi:hypothetical protein